MPPALNDHDQLESLLALAASLAAQAGAVHRQWLGRRFAVATKSAAGDFVSEVDRRCEELLVSALSSARPADGILAEEGTVRAGSSGFRWVIDPLDGTANYVHGYPAFCASVAVEVGGRAVVGAVCESSTGDVYTALAGGRATRNGETIAVAERTDLSAAIVGTGFSFDAALRRRQGLVVAEILPRIADIRRSGSAALDLCRLAEGRLDAYFELDLSPWDHAAGGVIAEAAGARILTLEASWGRGPAIVGANPYLIDPLVDLLRDAGALA